MSRWPTVTGLWLGTGAWLYAVLAVVELRELDFDPTEPDVGYVGVADYVPALTYATSVLLGLALVGSLWSLTTGRARRATDASLAAGLLLGGAFLWAADQPRPTAPVVVALAALPLSLAVLLPATGPAPARAFLPRLLMVVPALLMGWVCLHELAEGHWRLSTTSSVYWLGVAVAAAMVVVAALLPLLRHAAWRWLLGIPTLLLGLAWTGGAFLGLREGYLLSGFEENEDGWMLGGPLLFLGLGFVVAGLAALRDRWALAAGTVGTTVLVLLAVVFGIPEIRSGY